MNLLKVLGCVLLCVLEVAAQDSACNGKIPDSDCAKGKPDTGCKMEVQWLVQNEKCPEAGDKHPTILMPAKPAKQDYWIYSQYGMPFKIATIKEYNAKYGTGKKVVCDWDSPFPYEPSASPFTEDPTDPDPYSDLRTYATDHDLTLTDKCGKRMACYKLELVFAPPDFAVGQSGSVSGELAIDPHIQTGGNTVKLEETCAYQECMANPKNKVCLYQKCIANPKNSENWCLEQLENLNKAH